MAQRAWLCGCGTRKAAGGSGGGGRPDMAQAGGSMPDKLDEAIAQTPAIIARILG